MLSIGKKSIQIAVLAIDLFGFGTRIEEASHFYKRYPEWSKMGKMITDVSYCLDALERFDFIDDRNIFLLGNTLGGKLALMAAALDDRVAGLAVLSAFSPWRTSTAQFESIRNESHQYGLIPRLGFFASHPEDAPVDIPEIIAGIAPRPLLIIAPTLDRHADFPEVKRSVQSVRKIYDLYGRGANLRFQTPREINRMTESMYGDISRFFLEVIQ
jgi:pimeloyl-ACP methyl ester carboxylesterase